MGVCVGAKQDWYWCVEILLFVVSTQKIQWVLREYSFIKALSQENRIGAYIATIFEIRCGSWELCEENR